MREEDVTREETKLGLMSRSQKSDELDGLAVPGLRDKTIRRRRGDSPHVLL